MRAGEEDLAQRQLRRAVLRAHHPDLGGDPAELARQLAALQQPTRPDHDISFVRRLRGRQAVAAWFRRRTRRARRAKRRRVS